MNKPNHYKKYSVHEDTNSDFTVLDLHKEEEDFHDIVSDNNSVRTAGNSIHYTNKLQTITRSSNSSSSASSGTSPSEDLTKNITVKRNLQMAVSKLDKLLQYEENLNKRSEIFHCIGALHSLVGDIKTAENSNGNKCELEVQLYLYPNVIQVILIPTLGFIKERKANGKNCFRCSRCSFLFQSRNG